METKTLNLIDMIRVAACSTESNNDRDVAGQQLTEASAAADNAGMTDIGDLLMNMSDRLYKDGMNLPELAGEINELANKARDNVVFELEAAVRVVLNSSIPEEQAIHDGLTAAQDSLCKIQAFDLADRLRGLRNAKGLGRSEILASMAGVRSELTGVPLVQAEFYECGLEEIDSEDMEEIPPFRKMRGGETYDDEYDLGRRIFTGEIPLPDTLDRDVPYDLDDDSESVLIERNLPIKTRKEDPLNVDPVPNLEDAMDAPPPVGSPPAPKPREELPPVDPPPSEVRTEELPPVREQKPADDKVMVFRGIDCITFAWPSELGALVEGGVVEPNDAIHYANGNKIYVRDMPELMDFLPKGYKEPSDNDFFTKDENGEDVENADIIRDFMSDDPPPGRDVFPERPISYMPFAAGLIVFLTGAGVIYNNTQVPATRGEGRHGFCVDSNDSPQEPWDYESWNGPSSDNEYVPEVCVPTAEDIAAVKAANVERQLFLERKEGLRSALLAWQAKKKQER